MDTPSDNPSLEEVILVYTGFRRKQRIFVTCGEYSLCVDLAYVYFSP